MQTDIALGEYVAFFGSVASSPVLVYRCVWGRMQTDVPSSCDNCSRLISRPISRLHPGGAAGAAATLSLAVSCSPITSNLWPFQDSDLRPGPPGAPSLGGSLLVSPCPWWPKCDRRVLVNIWEKRGVPPSSTSLFPAVSLSPPRCSPCPCPPASSVSFSRSSPSTSAAVLSRLAI